MTTWTKRDRVLARVSPYFVMRKLDTIIEENTKVDEEAAWEKTLTTAATQEAAIRLSQQEVARIERIEDKLNRQQPIAALLTSFATGLLVAAWLRGEILVVIVCLVALCTAVAALLTSARVNHFFQEHTLTPSELKNILNHEGDRSAAIAARAVVDTQKNLPYQSRIGNRNEAARHAVTISMVALVIAALLFAVPNWGSEKSAASRAALDRLQNTIHDVRSELRQAEVVDRRDQARDRRLARQLRDARRELHRIRSRVRQNN